MKLFKKFLAIMALVIPAIGIIPVQANPGAVTTVATQVTANATNKSIKEAVTNIFNSVKDSDAVHLACNTGSIVYDLSKGTLSLSFALWRQMVADSSKVKEIFKILASSNALFTIFIVGSLYASIKLYLDWHEFWNSEIEIKTKYHR